VCGRLSGTARYPAIDEADVTGYAAAFSYKNHRPNLERGDKTSAKHVGSLSAPASGFWFISADARFEGSSCEKGGGLLERGPG